MSGSFKHTTAEEIMAEIEANKAIVQSIDQQMEMRKGRTGDEHEAWAIRARDKRAYVLKTISDLQRRLGGNDPSAATADNSNEKILREHNILLNERVNELTTRVNELETANSLLTARLRAIDNARS